MAWLLIGQGQAMAADTAFDTHTATTTAFEADCVEQTRQTLVDVRFDPGDMTFDLTRSAAQLTSMKSSGGRWKTSGLTTMTQKFSLRTRTRIIRDIGGRGCALPHFELTVDVQPQRVYIGREFASGSCAFDEIMAHEMRHVDANRQHAARVTEAFAAELREAYSRSPQIGDPATLNDQIVRSLKSEWLPKLKSELERGDALHEAIDSRDEFDRLTRACGGDIAVLLAPRAMR